MFTGPRLRRGFTIIEALVSAALTGVGVAAAILGIRSLTRTATHMFDYQKEQRLAIEKYHEITAVQDFTTPSGDFVDHFDNNYVWEMQTNPVTLQTATNTSTQNLVRLQVTVHPSNGGDPSDKFTLEGLVYIPPQSGSAAPGAANGGGGAGGARPGGGTTGGRTAGGG